MILRTVFLFVVWLTLAYLIAFHVIPFALVAVLQLNGYSASQMMQIATEVSESDLGMLMVVTASVVMATLVTFSVSRLFTRRNVKHA